VQFHLSALITPGFDEINLALFRSELLEIEAAIAKLDSESGGQELPDLEKEIDALEQERKLAEDEVDRVGSFDPFLEKC
jgi:hypothetical protein